MPTYIVRAGDTLERIAIRECGDRSFVQKIAKDNNIANVSRIFVGQKLTINCDSSVEPEKPAPPPIPQPPKPEPPKPVEPPQPDTSVPGRVLLNVPYHSQEDQDAKWAGADCGPTCVRMLIGWSALRQGKPDSDITVDEVSQKTGMGQTRFSFPSQLVGVGTKYGLKLYETRQATLERILQEIDAGRPVICLVRYGSLTRRQNQMFRGGHFIVVVGYDKDSIILNDPDWWGSRRSEGAGFRVPRAEFERAIGADSLKAGNPPYWAVFVSPQ